MNRERAKTLLPIIQAFAEGKDIEVQLESGAWVFSADPIFSQIHESEFRIKPEPFECWVNVYGGRDDTLYAHKTKETAIRDGTNGNGYVTAKTIHMREVE